LNPDDLSSPVGAALSSSVAFAIGASLLLIPFLWRRRQGDHPRRDDFGNCAFVVVALLSLFSGKNALRSGLRMLAIGAVAAGVFRRFHRLFSIAAD